MYHIFIRSLSLITLISFGLSACNSDFRVSVKKGETASVRMQEAEELKALLNKNLTDINLAPAQASYIADQVATKYANNQTVSEEEILNLLISQGVDAVFAVAPIISATQKPSALATTVSTIENFILSNKTIALKEKNELRDKSFAGAMAKLKSKSSDTGSFAKELLKQRIDSNNKDQSIESNDAIADLAEQLVKLISSQGLTNDEKMDVLSSLATIITDSLDQVDDASFVSNTVSTQVTNNVEVENMAALVANIYKNSILALKPYITSSNTSAIQVQLDNLVAQANTDLNTLKTAGKITASQLSNALAVVSAAQSEIQAAIDTRIPAPTGTLAFSGLQSLTINSSNLSAFTLSGSCLKVGGSVSLSGPFVESITCSATGTWSKTLNLSAQAEGSITFTISQGNKNAQITLSKDTLIPGAPNGLALSSPATTPANDTTPTLTVSGLEVGGKVRLYRDAACSTASSSIQSITGTSMNITGSALAAGNYTFYAKQSDAAGNWSACSAANIAYELDISHPGTPNNLALDDPTSSPNNDATPSISVENLEVGASVQLFSDNTCESAISSATTVVSSTQIITTSALTEGSYTIYAMQVDVAGNPSSCGGPLAYQLIDKIVTLAVKSGSPAGLTADGTSTTLLEVTIKKNNGDPISSESVTLAIPTDGGTATQNPVITDASGIAEFEITSSTVIGTYTYRASIAAGPIFSNAVYLIFSTCSGNAITNVPFANWTGGMDPGGEIMICTAYQFNRIYDSNTYDGVTPVQRLSRSYRLASDIDLGGGVTMIGTTSNSFSGTFDGDGFAIKNININDASTNVGLFRLLNAATIQNLDLTVTSVSGNSLVGALAGAAVGGTIANVHVTGAALDGTSTVSGDAATNTYVGGLFGQGGSVTVTASSVNRLTVTGPQYTGGLFGGVSNIFNLTVNNSAVKADVTVSGESYIGGMAGNASGVDASSRTTINRSYSKATVSGTITNIGGLLGSSIFSTITDSYSQANVNASNPNQGDYVGGFVGLANNADITTCYSTANVCGGDCTATTNDGPFTGAYSGTRIGIFWDNQTSGWTSHTIGTPRSTAHLQERNTFQTIYGDAYNFATVWRIPSGGGYPIHQWEEPMTAPVFSDIFTVGAGTDADPYEISTLQQLRDMVYARQIDSAAWNTGKVYELTTNIDYADVEVTLIGDSATVPFRGKFYGNNFTISNLSINIPNKSFIALFRYTNGATIQDLSITAASVIGASNTGVLVGHAAGGSIHNVHLTGVAVDGSSSITGWDSVGGLMGVASGTTVTRTSVDQFTIHGNNNSIGGLVGTAISSASFTESYTDAATTVRGVRYVGGLIGSQSSATATRSFSKANVTGTTSSIGGLVGRGNSATITNSYAQGNVNIGAAATQGNMIGGLLGESVDSVIQHCFSSSNVCGGACTAASSGPFSGTPVLTSTQNFWITEDSGWATAGTGVGTMTTAADFSTDGDTSGIVDALEGAGWNATYWELNPAVTGGYPELQWVLP